MIDISNCYVKTAIVHYISSPIEKNKSILSHRLIQNIEKFHKEFLTLAFNKFEENEINEFIHETDISFNETYSFCKDIILNDDEDIFIKKTQDIAKHLIDVSRHPNIRGGELLIIRFSGVKYDNKNVEILSVLKIEDKEKFLKVDNINNQLSLFSSTGINLKQNNKAALIMFSKENNESTVFVKNRKADETVFWREQFLKVTYKVDDRYQTNKLLNECRGIITKNPNITPDKKMEYLSKSINFFKNEKSFDAENYVENIFVDIKTEDKSELKNQLKKYEIEINKNEVKKNEKKFKKTIILDNDINIKISLDNVSDINHVIEKGYDKSKNKSYYKIYFKEEK